MKDAARCGLGRVLVHGDNNNVAPRVGLTWQANSKTVVRGGFGIFSGRDENVGVARRLPTNPPFVTSATFVGDQNTPAFLLKDGFPANALSFASVSLDVINWPIYNKLPYVSQWNINIERQLPREFVFQVGYTESGAKKMAGVVAINQPSPGTGNGNARRPYYGWDNMLSYNQYVASSYNGMIAKMERRFSKGMTLLASYTLGHSIDGGGNNNDSSDLGPQDVRNTAAQKGNSNFDIRHRFVVSRLYQLPFGKSRGPLQYLVRDWQLSGIFSTQTGQPFTVTSSTDPSGTNTTARPNRLRDGSLPSDQRYINHWFDLTAFANTDLRVFRQLRTQHPARAGIHEPGFGRVPQFRHRRALSHRVSRRVFQPDEHPIFGIPGVAIGNQTAGIICTVVNPERQNQLAMKLRF